MAGRIPENFINELVARVNIADVIAARGVSLRKTGASMVSCCPFHDEKTPSFHVNIIKQVYHCFGCNAGGGAIQFIMNYDGIDFISAVEQLAAQYNLQIPKDPIASRANNITADLYSINLAAAEFYSQQLKSHPNKQQAISYLKARGISGQTAKIYNIGFAPEGWKNLYRELTASKIPEQQLTSSGLIIVKSESKKYDRFRNRIMFPIQDQRGRTIGFGGRSISDATMEAKYINSPETAIFSKGEELYGLYEAKKANRKLEQILVVEGYFDVVVLHNAGISNAVATLGTAVSLSHIKMLFKITDNIIFGFDGDLAGRNAAWRALSLCLPILPDGKSVKFLLLPEGSDPDSYVSEHGKEKFLKQLAMAATLSDFLFSTLMHDLDLSRLEHKTKLAAEAKPLLEQVGSYLLRQLLYNKLSTLLGLDLGALQGNTQSAHNSRYRTSKATKIVPLASLSATIRAIAMLLRNRDLVDLIEDWSVISSSELPDAKFFYAVALSVRDNVALQQSYASRLANYELDAIIAGIPPQGIESEFTGAVQRIVAQVYEYETDLLLRKAESEQLSAEEKSNLCLLLQQHR